jgi:hypothetical protein
VLNPVLLSLWIGDDPQGAALAGPVGETLLQSAD